MEIKISVKKISDAAVITCEGQLETGTNEELRRALSDILDKGTVKIVIDMSKINFMSSSGWGAVIGYLRQARNGGGDIVLAAMSEHVRDGYCMAEFNEIIDAYDTVEKAIEGLAKKKHKK